MNSNRNPSIWICVVLLLSLAGVYWPVLRNQFIHCDDPEYIINNPPIQSGLTWQGFIWAFTTGHANNWHPLTWLSHMLDCQVFGMNPGLHHLTSALFHAANTLLLFLVLRSMTAATWRSAFVAALFGLHPLHVESVAWVSERKDVLSTFFFLLSVWSYAAYAKSKVEEQRSEVRGQKSEVRSQKFTFHVSAYYALSLVLFACGLMSKPMLVTLPFVLLLLDYWPLQRLSFPALRDSTNPGFRLALEKAPFFILSAAACIATIIVQRQEGNMISTIALPLHFRLSNALISCLLYMTKTLWPAHLAAYYPLPNTMAIELLATAAAVVIGISVVAFTFWRRLPYLAVGWLWFLGTLIPVIGLVQVGLQARADRYTYIPLIGLFITITWAISDGTRNWRYQRTILGAGSIGILGACAVLSCLQVRLWRNSETLFRHALAVTRNNAHAHLNLGAALMEQAKFDEAGEHFAEALRIRPGYAEAQSNLGFTLARKGKVDEAIAAYRAALAAKPRLLKTHYLLGNALSSQGKRAEAVAEYKTELQNNPDHPLALNDLAWALAVDPELQQRNGVQAVTMAERACRLTEFQEPLFIGTLAAAYAEAGRFDDAVKTAEKAKALATEQGQTDVAAKNQELLELYRAGKPYHEADQAK